MKVAIIQYSTYGHVTKLSESVKEGVVKTGLATQVDIFQVPETLSEDVLKLIHAPAKPDYPIATTKTLEEYDAFLFGLPTRFGNLPAQFIDFFGQTGGLWASGALYHKPAGVFVSTGSPNGGQETTIRHFLSYVAHHGFIYIPLGYGPAFPLLTTFDEIHGGSPYGAGSYAGSDGSRQPNETEINLCIVQGEEFAKSASKFVTSAPSPADSTPADASTTAVATPADVSTPAEATTSEKPVKETAAKRSAQTTTTIKKDEDKGCGIKCVIV